MKNILTLSFLLFYLASFGQIQTGKWTSSSIKTTTDSAVGIGTYLPDAWQEIRYCPPTQHASEAGFIVTLNKCNQSTLTFNPLLNDYIGGSAGIDSLEPIDTFAMPFSFLTSHMTNTIQPLYSNEEPIMWARVKKPPMAAWSGIDEYDTKFIVMPDGSTGINVAHPRAALDVRGSQSPNYPAAIFGSRAMGAGTTNVGNGLYQYFTQQVHIVPYLKDNGYNKISEDSDQGIFFSDGQGNEGANDAGALVIAPWANNNDTLIGGLRIDKWGNLEVHGNILSTKVKVQAKWWSDFVFEEGYELMSLSDVESFINENGHLPNMPSEEELTKDGLDVFEMLALQQQKIEELTLYIIEIEKRLNKNE